MAKTELQTRTNRKTNRFRLEPYSGGSTRHQCPNCGHKKSFARFIDLTTGDYLGDDIGRCNRVERCGYIKTPTTDDFKGNLFVSKVEVKKEYQYLDEDIVDTIDGSYVLKSMTGVEKSILGEFLIRHFSEKVVLEILHRYRLGVGNLWEGDILFWQLDEDYRARTGKIMLYEEDGKRKKEPFNHINWVHSPDKNLNYGYKGDYHLKQCFFGTHLVNEFDKTTPVRVVESEKTAIICAINKPDDFYVATGGINMISRDRLLPFKGREIILYPDKGEKAVEIWQNKSTPLKDEFDIKVNTSLEKLEQLNEGDDLADVILRMKTE